MSDPKFGEGRKYDLGKARMGLLPWGALHEVAKVLTFGGAKYASNNWQNVESFQARYEDALLRHYVESRRGRIHDQESGLHVLAHAACDLLFLLSEAVGHDEPRDESYFDRINAEKRERPTDIPESLEPYENEHETLRPSGSDALPPPPRVPEDMKLTPLPAVSCPPKRFFGISLWKRNALRPLQKWQFETFEEALEKWEQISEVIREDEEELRLHNPSNDVILRYPELTTKSGR
jgi:hypothetical protein